MIMKIRVIKKTHRSRINDFWSILWLMIGPLTLDAMRTTGSRMALKGNLLLILMGQWKHLRFTFFYQILYVCLKIVIRPSVAAKICSRKKIKLLKNT